MKKHNPYLPVLVTVFSIASICMLYGKTANYAPLESESDIQVPIDADLKNVSGKQLLDWMKDHKIEYVSQNPKQVEEGNYSVYLEHAAPQEAVQIFCTLLKADWRRQGDVFVLTPAKPKSAKAPEAPSLLQVPQLATPATAITEDPNPNRPEFVDEIIQSLSPEQHQSNVQNGFIDVEELDAEQQSTLKECIGEGRVDFVIFVDGKTHRFKGTL